jgi:uncharacterized protein
MEAVRARVAAVLVFTLVEPVLAAERWRGHAGNDVHGVTLEVDLSGEHGSFSIPELGALEIPLARVTRATDRLQLEIDFEGSVLRFDGTLAGDVASGSYSMGPMAGSFRLERSTPQAKPYREEEVHVPSEGALLAGTLLLPRSSKPLAAAVFLHGSGRTTRDGNRYLADRLARNGVAALIFDKRGCGASTGSFAATDLDGVAADAAAAVAFLRTRKDVAADRVGFVGASQAGWVGVSAAAKTPDIAFFAFTSAPVVSVARESWWDYEAKLRERKFSEAEIAEAREILRLDDEVTRTGRGFEELERAVAAAKGTPWFEAMQFHPAPADDEGRAAFREIMDFDPVPVLRTLDVPALWIYAGHDMTMPADWSIDNLVTLIKEGKDYSLRVFPSANHAMIVMPDHLADGGWPHRVPEHAEVVTRWIVHTLTFR